MSDMQFDRHIQLRIHKKSRRQMLGVIAGAATVLTGAGAVDAKTIKSKGKAKAKRNGQGTVGAPGQQPKVGVCHFDKRSELYMYLELPPPAANAHTKHGDQSLTEADCLALNSPQSGTPEE